jgi:thymidylate synthase ThyX
MHGGLLSDPFTRRIYLLDPHRFKPETIAVTFAKSSRSPESFDVIAEDLSDEKSAEFTEKWVVGYGHSSVAEHAVLHIAIENVTRLAVECIESNRLASYTEKSSRYQKWDSQAFFTPGELEGHPLKAAYQKTCESLFTFYLECQPQLRAQLARACPQKKDESDSAFERRLNSAALDVARYLMPAASLANLGMTANARTLEHAISKMLSSPLEEVRQVGQAIKEASCASVPTLIKYAATNEHLSLLADRIAQAACQPPYCLPSGDWLTLVNFDPLGVERILASLQFRYGSSDFENCLKAIMSLTSDEKRSLLETALGEMGKHDCLPHEFEHIFYTFDVIMDQGAYYEFKRHRMMTQSPQELGASLGYSTPRLFKESGLLDRYQQLMGGVATTWAKLAEWNPAVASYVIPNGFNRRILFSLNLREAYTLIRLRTAPQAHFSIRRVACRMTEEIRNAHPLLGDILSHGTSENSKLLTSDFFL